MTHDDLCFTPATRLVALIRSRKISPLELTRAVLERIERVNPRAQRLLHGRRRSSAGRGSHSDARVENDNEAS